MTAFAPARTTAHTANTRYTGYYDQPALASTLAVVGGAAVLGLGADLLLRHAGLGLNVFVWIAGLAAWSTYLARGHTLVRPSPDAWQLPAVLFAAFFALRADPALRALDLLAIAAALALPLLRAHGETLWRAGIAAWTRAMTTLAGHAAFGSLLLVFKDTRWDEVTAMKGGTTLRRVLLGALLTAPIVLVFGGIFAAADPVFGGALERLLAADLEPLVEHGVVIVFFGALAAGYLRARLWGASDFDVVRPFAGIKPAVPWTPLAMMTGSMTALFLLFVAVQARSLFGGAEFVAGATGLTLAEYARSGFFECVVACGLSLPVLMAADTLLDRSDSAAVKSLRALTLVQVLLIGVVLASAVMRLSLYTGAYGLTQDRVLGAAALTWLGLTTSWFGFTVLRGRREQFTFGAVASGFAVLAALNFANPAAIVARVNIARAEAGGGAELDVAHLGGLSADATPAVVSWVIARPETDVAACTVLSRLRERHAKAAPRDWRDFTLAHYRAERALNQAASRPAPCPQAI